jgi:hypothetical protein
VNSYTIATGTIPTKTDIYSLLNISTRVFTVPNSKNYKFVARFRGAHSASINTLGPLFQVQAGLILTRTGSWPGTSGITGMTIMGSSPLSYSNETSVIIPLVAGDTITFDATAPYFYNYTGSSNTVSPNGYSEIAQEFYITIEEV